MATRAYGLYFDALERLRRFMEAQRSGQKAFNNEFRKLFCSAMSEHHTESECFRNDNALSITTVNGFMSQRSRHRSREGRGEWSPMVHSGPPRSAPGLCKVGVVSNPLPRGPAAEPSSLPLIEGAAIRIPSPCQDISKRGMAALNGFEKWH